MLIVHLFARNIEDLLLPRRLARSYSRMCWLLKNPEVEPMEQRNVGWCFTGETVPKEEFASTDNPKSASWPASSVILSSRLAWL
jgi:hypothetical protein